MQSSSRSIRPPTHGFSLVEVLVAVTIIGIAAGLTVPKIARMSNQTKVHRAARAFRIEVEQAFAIAARNRAPVKITWSSSAMQLQVTNLAGSAVYRRLGIGAGAYGLTSTEVSMTPATLVVFPNGLAADSLVINLTRSPYSRTVRVSRSGLVRQQ